ncbi:hypothetical protein GCM10009631_10060 [Corynebacterium glaucum]
MAQRGIAPTPSVPPVVSGSMTSFRMSHEIVPVWLGGMSHHIVPVGNPCPETVPRRCELMSRDIVPAPDNPCACEAPKQMDSAPWQMRHVHGPSIARSIGTV